MCKVFDVLSSSLWITLVAQAGALGRPSADIWGAGVCPLCLPPVQPLETGRKRTMKQKRQLLHQLLLLDPETGQAALS